MNSFCMHRSGFNALLLQKQSCTQKYNEKKFSIFALKPVFFNLGYAQSQRSTEKLKGVLQRFPFCVLILLLLLLDPFRGMGVWQKTMEPHKPGSSPGPGPKVVERQRVAKEQEFVAGQCRMR